MKKEKQKTAVITGATGGIGREIATCFLKAGVSIYLLGRNFDQLRSVTEIKEGLEQGNVHFCKVDLFNENELLRTVELINKSDKIDFLIHGAAFYNHGEFETSNVTDLDRSYRVNVRAPYLLSLELLPKLISGNGVIVFLNSSVVTGSGKKKLVQYASTKSALKSMADCLRQDVNSKGVRVITFILGKVATPMQQKACESEGTPYKPDKMVQPKDAAKLIYQTSSAPAGMEITDIYIRPSVKYE